MILSVLGWITVVIGITEFFTYFARKFRLRFLGHFRGEHHMAWGKAMIVAALVHGLASGTFFTFGLGTICWCVLLALYGTYRYRQKLGKSWLKAHRWLSLAAIVLAVLHIITEIT